MVDKKDIVKILESENIKFDLIEHEAVYTMDDIEKLNLGNYGTEVKNLFLRDEKGKNHFLIIAKEDTKIDMKELKNIINSSRLSFASEDRLKKYLPHEVEFEANNGGHEYSDKVDEKLREAGVRMNITNRKAPSKQSKLGKILQYTPEIKNFYFLDSSHRTKEYEKFMREVTTFSQTGKNPHDKAIVA